MTHKGKSHAIISTLKAIGAGALTVVVLALLLVGIKVAFVDEVDNSENKKAVVANSDVHLQVRSLGGDGTRVFYTENGKDNIEVGTVDNFWEVTIPFNRLTSVTIQTSPGAIADCEVHMYNNTVTAQTIGENSWQNCAVK